MNGIYLQKFQITITARNQNAILQSVGSSSFFCPLEITTSRNKREISEKLTN